MIGSGRPTSLGETSDSTQRLRRGIGVGMRAQGNRGNTGSPIGWWRVTTHRTPARDRPGPVGWRRGPQYRGSRVMPVEGRGLGSRPA